MHRKSPRLLVGRPAPTAVNGHTNTNNRAPPWPAPFGSRLQARPSTLKPVPQPSTPSTPPSALLPQTLPLNLQARPSTIHPPLPQTTTSQNPSSATSSWRASEASWSTRRRPRRRPRRARWRRRTAWRFWWGAGRGGAGPGREGPFWGGPRGGERGGLSAPHAWAAAPAASCVGGAHRHTHTFAAAVLHAAALPRIERRGAQSLHYPDLRSPAPGVKPA